VTRPQILRRIGLAIAVLCIPAGPALAETNGWAKATRPAPGTARVHGFYSKGCVSGARSLPVNGRGFAVLRPHRNRFWGHPSLITFVHDLAARVARGDRVLLIADLGQPRGGPVSGHASHQLGLDADIRLLMLPRSALTQTYRTKPPYFSMLPPDKKAVDWRRWSASQIALIRAAARLAWWFRKVTAKPRKSAKTERPKPRRRPPLPRACQAVLAR
jgi:penicillin-insensitive murein endopeptidase